MGKITKTLASDHLPCPRFAMPTTYNRRFIPASVLYLTLAFISSCRARSYQTLVIGEVAQRDTGRSVYEINFPELGEHLANGDPGEDAPDMTSMRIVTARGQAMRCMLPKPVKASTAPPRGNDEAPFDDIDELLSEYEGKCFLLMDGGWWTYQFCYGDKIVQQHIIPKDRDPTEGEVEDSYLLGQYDRELDLERRKNVADVSTDDSAFTQVFVNGTICATTDKPRRVLVKYLCSDDVRLAGIAKKSAQSSINLLKSVREVESCVYEVEFISSAICKHPKYKEKRANSARPIHCSMDKDEGPFEGLLSRNYKKASLNL